MEVSNSRWVILLVIAVTVLVAALFAVLVPILNYQLDPGSVQENSKWVLPTRTAVPEVPDQPASQANSGLISSLATPTSNPNCTHSPVYWVYHLDQWPEQIIQGDLTYSREQAQRIIQSTNLDAFHLLLIHYLAAYLNYDHGADMFEIEGVMAEASQWLSDHPQDSPLSVIELQQAYGLAERLEDFNIGIIGPGRCLDDMVALAGQVAIIPVPILSVTPAIILSPNVVTLPPNPATPSLTPTTPTARITILPPTATTTAKPARKQAPKPTQRPPTREPPPTEPRPPTDEPPPPPPPNPL